MAAPPPITRRSHIYKTYNEFKQDRDTRDMDTICKSSSSGSFSLQAQQKWLKQYVRENEDWSPLLMYHQIGSGKTCTAITIAEEFLKKNKNGRIKVILPARLRTNFIDELISPCGKRRYMSKENYNEYMKTTSDTTRKKLMKEGEKRIEKNYDIMSIEKFVKNALQHKDNLKAWAEDFTKDTLVIVDEVHNLLSTGYDEKAYANILEKGKIEKKSVQGINSVIFKYMVQNAHKSSKMLYMTATPIFDHLTQFTELVGMLNPTADLSKHKKTLFGVINLLRGRVSYFPGTSQNAYPTVSYKKHKVTMSRTQDIVIADIRLRSQDMGAEESEAFKSLQRQACIASLPDEASVADNMETVLGDLDEYAPKVKKLLKNIEKTTVGKHMVYSSFVQVGTKLVEAALRKRGWVSLKEAVAKPELFKKKAFKIYGTWDGEVKDDDKKMIKTIVNSKDNLKGEKVRVIIGSPAMKEGVSFKHIQHVHILDPVWNSSAKDQVEGRAIRFCSHVDIPRDHKDLTRNVVIHLYKLVTRKENGSEVPMAEATSDMEIYDEIIPRKEAQVKKAEALLKRVSIDYHLFRKMHEDANWDGKLDDEVDETNAFKRSALKISRKEGNALLVRKLSDEEKDEKDINSTCPKKRRPDKETKQCKPGFYKKDNKHGAPCCYKIKGAQVETQAGQHTKVVRQRTKGCPINRRPNEKNECPKGFYVKINKHGAPCCYQKRAKKQ